MKHRFTHFIVSIVFLAISTNVLGVDYDTEKALEKAIVDLTALINTKEQRFDLFFAKTMSEIRLATPDLREKTPIFLTTWLKGFELLALNTTILTPADEMVFLNLAPPSVEGEPSIAGVDPKSVKNKAQREAYIKALKENSDRADAVNFQADISSAQSLWMVFFDSLIHVCYSQTSESDYKMLINAIRDKTPKGKTQDKLIMTVKKRWKKAKDSP